MRGSVLRFQIIVKLALYRRNKLPPSAHPSWSVNHLAGMLVDELMSTSGTAIPDFAKGDGLLPAIAQDADTGEVLMLAWMNPESYAETVATGRAVYFSRGRGKLWRKGEESGHVQYVEEIYVDCDADTILLKVRQTGPACHDGYRSCFFRRHTDGNYPIVAPRLVDPATVYRKGT